MDPYVGEIRILGFNWAPDGWSLTNGATLTIQQNQALFSLLSTSFGGNGTTNFMLPNLMGRLPLGMGAGSGLTNRVMGQAGGVESVALNINHLPAHNHTAQISATTNNATTGTPVAGAYLSKVVDTSGGGAPTNIYYSGATPPLVPLSAGNTSITGSGQAVSLMNPFLVVNFCIALLGTYPMRP